MAFHEVLFGLINFIIALVLMLVGTGIVMIVVFPDAVKHKDNSRLVRWPRAIKRFCHDVSETLDSLTNGAQARRKLKEIETGQSELTL